MAENHKCRRNRRTHNHCRAILREEVIQMAKRPQNDPYWRLQWNGIRQPHVAPFNELVDEIKSPNEFVPYIAPCYGGDKARLLGIFLHPGPATKGTGLLWIDSPDRTAERFRALLAGARINVKDLMVWNTYPWYIHSEKTALSPAQKARGLEPLKWVIDHLPNLKVIMTMGDDAKDATRDLKRQHPEYTWIHPNHTSPRHYNSLGRDTPAQKAFQDKLIADFAEAAAALAQP